jgi:hypothetical protein
MPPQAWRIADFFDDEPVEAAESTDEGEHRRDRCSTRRSNMREPDALEVAELPDRDADLIDALLTGCTQAEAGRRCGMSERTVRRRLAGRRFAAELHAARRFRWDRANARATALLGEAYDVVAAVMQFSEVDRDRLAAARLLLGQGARLQLEELSDRLERLEELLAGCEGWMPDQLDPELPTSHTDE